MASPANTNTRYPEVSDIISIKWPSTHTTDQVRVQSITPHSITLQYLDNNDIEERQFEDGLLPFEWQLLEKYNPPSPQLAQPTDPTHYKFQPHPTDPPMDNNQNTNNNNNDTDHYKQQYFQKKRAKYDEIHAKPNPSKPKSKMKRKQVPQQRSIARNLSAVTNTENEDEYTPLQHQYAPPPRPQPQDNYSSNRGTRWQPKSKPQFVPHPMDNGQDTNTDTITTDLPAPKMQEAHHEPSKVVDSARLPLKGDLVEISYKGGAQHDPVRIIHCNYNGDARVRYTDAQGANNNVNFLHNRDISFKITNSVYSSPDINFIPAPRRGDTVELRWTADGGRDVVYILNVDVEYNEEYSAEQDKNSAVEEFKVDDMKQDLNHYDKFTAIWVTFEYPDDKEREKLNFHPNSGDTEILSWRILECGDTAGLELGDDIKMDELDNEICTVCCTTFGEFPFRTVVPCAHNNVCAKCTLRMRVFGDFNNDKHPYPMCPFCKESWEIVAFVPLSWTISINHAFEDRDSPQNTLSKNEWNTVFQRPLEYDDEIQCYFTDIHILQQFIHIRSLYCLLCNPPNKAVTNYNKVYYFHNVGKLLGHLRHDHTSFMCDLCLNNATLFMDEQRIFMNNKKLLIDHQRNGSAIEGQYGETSPHPFCTLCRRNFYSRESLYEHCEDTHCSCHLCKQSDILEYYASADILSEHHRNLHHLCEHRECLAKLQPVVFNDPLLLKSHQMQAHRMNKPVDSVRTAFTYGDDTHYDGRIAGGTMNFSTMFSQTDINYLSASRYGSNIGQFNQQNPAQMVDISEEQRARNRQRELHRTMDQIKQRWFPHSFQREQQQRHKQQQAVQLRLKHIPDAVPSTLREEKNTVVIKQIRKTLISELNFKQFQIISHSYNHDKTSSSVFFHRFKGLFDPLCGEDVWVNILIQMLALLRDGKKRRALYEEYRDWVIGGRVNTNTRIRSQYHTRSSLASSLRKGGIASNASRKAPQKTNVPSAAAIVAGLYRKPTKEMIMSQRRAQKGARKGSVKMMSKSTNVTASASPSNVKGKWKTGAPQINIKNKNKKHKKKDPNIPKITSRAPTVQQHWPTLAPAKEGPKAPLKIPKWVEELEEAPPIVSPVHTHAHGHSTPHKKGKGSKRGPRKSKKHNKDAVMKKSDVLTAVAPMLTAVASQPPSSNIPKAKAKLTPKGKMPHELSKNNKKTTFNKSNPWGVAPKSPPQNAVKKKTQSKPPQNNSNNKTKPLLAPKQKQKQKQKQKAKQNKNKSKKANKVQKKTQSQSQPQLQQPHEMKTTEDKKEKEIAKKANECYFELLMDAKSELQSAYVKLSNFKETLYANDKVALFLLFLFECLYCIFEFNFDGKIKYESVELTKAWRQHIYQSVYEQFWSKMDAKIMDATKRIKLKQASFKLRLGENVVRWNPFLYKLPALTENSGTQFGALYDMLGAIEDDTMDMTPLKPWIDQMDLKFDETYCMLLYLWLILDIELPGAPYAFIEKRSIKKEVRQESARAREENFKPKAIKVKSTQNKHSSPKTKQKQNQTEPKRNRKQKQKQNQQMHKKKANKKKQWSTFV